MNEKAITFIENLQKSIAGGAVQPRELIAAIKAVLKRVEKAKEETVTALSEVLSRLDEMEAKLDEPRGVDEATFRSELRTVMRLIEQESKRVQGAIPKAFDASSIVKRIDDVEKKIPELPKTKDLEPLLADMETRHKEDMQKLLDELNRKTERVGGVSAMGVRQAFKLIAHTEQPTGAINGSNTTYTVKNDIWWLAGFTLNGENIAQLPNYTIAGKTITFTTALPTAYSGKDFECNYIG